MQLVGFILRRHSLCLFLVLDDLSRYFNLILLMLGIS